MGWNPGTTQLPRTTQVNSQGNPVVVVEPQQSYDYDKQTQRATHTTQGNDMKGESMVREDAFLSPSCSQSQLLKGKRCCCDIADHTHPFSLLFCCCER
jgi:hypothetical protein